MKNSDSENAGIGCVIIFLLIFLVPLLTELLKVVIIATIIGSIIYAFYLLYQYDKRTSIITNSLTNLLNQIKLLLVKNEEPKTISLPPKEETTNENLPPEETKEEEEIVTETYALPEPEENILDQIKELNDKLEKVELENKQLKENQQLVIKQAVEKVTGQIDKKNKGDLLTSFYGKKEDNYTRSDEFEKQQFQEKNKKKKEELDIREVEQNLNERLLEQDKKIHVINLEMETGFLDVNYKLLHLEKDLTTHKGLVVEKFAEVETSFNKAFVSVLEQMSNLRVEVKQDVADIKVQFGNEVLRLDKQQLHIISKMQEYGNQVKAFTLDIIKVKLDAEKFSIRGEDLLNRANIVHERHKALMYVKAKDLEVGLQEIALHNNDFANKVGQAKLMLQEISQDQNFALKYMAYERIGINMLRQEHQQRASIEEQKINNLITKQSHLEEKIRMGQQRGREVEGLKHQLYMTQEDLGFSRNRANLMSQEFSVMRRLMK